MRAEEEIMTLILDFARNDDRVRAVLLNGSRANPDAIKDRFRDFDIVYVVTEFDSFLSDHEWINYFGERLILQMPEEMTIADSNHRSSFSYLMLFKDGNRIDLSLFPVDKIESDFKNDSQTVLLIDKDDIFKSLPPSSNKDYLIKKPAEKEFLDVCNEFWWVSTNVAKGLCRDEIIYAQHMLTVIVREMFLKIVEWHIGVENNFSVTFGQHGRNIKKLVPEDLYKKILSTYPDADKKNIWNSLFTMTELFDELALDISKKLNFTYNQLEASNVAGYLKSLNK